MLTATHGDRTPEYHIVFYSIVTVNDTTPVVEI